jgi:hypothetical protein
MPMLTTGAGNFPAIGGGGGGTLTYDPARKNPSSNLTLSGGNLTASVSANTFFAGVGATGSGRSSGKFYFEVSITAGFDNQGLGIGSAAATDYTVSPGLTGGAGWRVGAGHVFVDGIDTSTIQTGASPDVYACAVDFNNMRIWFRRAGSTNWNNNGSADPATNTGGISISGLSGGPWIPVVVLEITGDVFVANFGGSAYNMTPPSGFGNW